MAGAIAHHFNNQLQGVMGYLELAMGDLPEDGRAMTSVRRAAEMANRAADVSRQMLTYLGQTPGRRERLDLSEVYRQVIPMLRAGMPKRVVLKTDLPSSGPMVDANANQMEQVLINLVTNAWEAMPTSGGTIRLSVKTVPGVDILTGRRFPVDWQMGGDPWTCIEVRDDGSGVSQGDLEKVFDPFFSTKFTGRGLGLSIALGIVTAHGGGITVESPCRTGNVLNAERGAQIAEEGGDIALGQQDAGCVFRVFLPVYEEESSMPRGTAGREP